MRMDLLNSAGTQQQQLLLLVVVAMAVLSCGPSRKTLGPLPQCVKKQQPTPASFFKTNSYFCCCDSFFCISPLCSVYLCKLTAVRQIEINTFSYSVGRLGCFQFLVFVNNAAQNTFVQQSLSWVGLFPGAGILNVELQGQRAYAFLCL